MGTPKRLQNVSIVRTRTGSQMTWPSKLFSFAGRNTEHKNQKTRVFINHYGKGKSKCQIQNVGRSDLNQSVSERCQRQSVRVWPEARDQGQVRLQKTKLFIFSTDLYRMSVNVLGTILDPGKIEVNKDMSIKGCSWGMLTWISYPLRKPFPSHWLRARFCRVQVNTCL